jgi:putative FmdB family regulatory protein
MPTYDYICEHCGDFEHFQSITSPKLRKCPSCGARVTRKLGTGAGVIFKGSGFYETDYRSESYKQGEKAAKEASTPEPKAKPEKTAEKATEKKTKTKTNTATSSPKTP